VAPHHCQGADVVVGVLDDYGSLAEGLLSLYFVTGEDEWLVFAGMLLDVAVSHFTDGEGGFFDTADDAPALVRRPRDPADNAEPSGWFAVSNALVTYAAITESAEHRARAEQALRIVTSLAERAPRAVGWGLAAVTALADGPAEVSIAGDDAEPLARIVWHSSAPGAVIRYGDPGGEGQAMVCRHFVCQLPTDDPETLARQLSSRSRS
jgi:uncharacterized protein YyaL (SSP411 family)